MTDQPNTAQIRAAMEADPWHDGCRYVAPLCAALDAAREEIATTDREVFAQIARAEAAEARHEIDVRYIAKIEARMEAAEARIAAALDLCATTPTSPCDPHCRVIDIRRALTGDTE